MVLTRINFIFFTIILLPFWSSASDADTILNLKKNFGALGDGIHNDHQAFIDASYFLNERKGNATLRIPPGTYIVGRQLDYGVLVPLAYRAFADESMTNPYYKLGIPVFFISGCRNITILGEPGVVIKFQDDLLLGSFEASGKPIPLLDKNGDVIVPPTSAKAFIGDAIYIENSKNIKIGFLELNGNSEHIKLGGNISADGWQAGQTGIALNEVTHCTLENVNVHHFAVDGLQLRNSTASTIEKIEGQDINLLHCSFDYNGRQGLSWTGGSGLRASDCSFSHTGRGYNASIKKALSTSPGAGLDIEPESDPNVNIYRMVRGGLFTRCNFENNTGAGMVADLYDEKDYRIAQNISFDDCTFWGTTYWSIWVTHPAFMFTNCRIYGSAVHSFAGEKPGMETRFISCIFEDKPYSQKSRKAQPPYGNYLVEIAGGIRTTFDNCTFIAHKKAFHYLVCSQPSEEKSKFVVNNCKFLNASGTDKPKNSIAEGVLFKGKNEHIDVPASK